MNYENFSKNRLFLVGWPGYFNQMISARLRGHLVCFGIIDHLYMDQNDAFMDDPIMRFCTNRHIIWSDGLETFQNHHLRLILVVSDPFNRGVCTNYSFYKLVQEQLD